MGTWPNKSFDRSRRRFQVRKIGRAAARSTCSLGFTFNYAHKVGHIANKNSANWYMSMIFSDDKIAVENIDLKEIFSLFSSATEYELNQVYDQDGNHYFAQIDLDEEYQLNQEKREYALDAFRSVLFFLHRLGYRLEKDGQVIGLVGVESLFH